VKQIGFEIFGQEMSEIDSKIAVRLDERRQAALNTFPGAYERHG